MISYWFKKLAEALEEEIVQLREQLQAPITDASTAAIFARGIDNQELRAVIRTATVIAGALRRVAKDA